MRLRTLFAIFALSAQGVTQSPLFTSTERDQILSYWSGPTRYTSTLPDEAFQQGIWQVRLSPPGSIWLRNYNRVRKLSAPPTENAKPVTQAQRVWEKWVTARIAQDRFYAWQQARLNNLRVLGVALPPVDKDTPGTQPADPGPIPPELERLAGMPPSFATAVVPMRHEINFDDAEIRYQDQFRIWNQRYPYYRFGQGVATDGTPVKKLSAERMRYLFRLAGVTPAEGKVMRTVSMLEGGFDSINTYDTGYVSVGFIQFACLKDGAGALGGLLRSFKSFDPQGFDRDFRQFGIDVNSDGSLSTIDLATGEELVGSAAAKEIIEDKRLIAVFQRAGQLSDSFIAAQIRAAKEMFYPGDDTLTVTVGGRPMSGKVSDVIRSQAGIATLMDRKVNTGDISSLSSIVRDIASKVKPDSLTDLAKYEKAIVRRMRYRTNYLLESNLTQPH